MFLAKNVAEIETQSDSTVQGYRWRWFFAFPMENETATPVTNSTNMECLQYPKDKTYSLEALHKLPSVKKCPSSTTLPFLHQHLFSVFFLMLGCFDKKRSCMTDENFEQQLLLKANRHLVLTWTEITGTRTSLKIFPLHCYTASHSLYINSCDMMINIWRDAD